MRIGLLTLDESGRVVVFSATAEQILGYSAQETCGKPCEEVFTDLAAALADAGSNGRAGKGEIRLRTDARCKDGQKIPLVVTAYSAPPSDNRAAREDVVLTFQDAREAEKTENQPWGCPCGEFKHLDRLLSLDRFAAGIVHEIRNPLAGISTNAQYMLEKLGPAGPYREEMQDILADVADIEGIVTRVLDFAHPRKSQVRVVAIDDIVTEVLRFSKLPLRHHNIRLRANLKKPSAKVKVDVSQIKQVFFNIVRNACDAMPGGGELRVSTTPPSAGSQCARVEIEDTGKGIAKEHVKRVFDPFFSTRPDGTGLGLAISRKIVEGHGGRIEIKSMPGKGARFCIVLPAV